MLVIRVTQEGAIMDDRKCSILDVRILGLKGLSVSKGNVFQSGQSERNFNGRQE